MRALFAALLLSFAGCAVDPAPASPCCSVADVVRMAEAKVADDVIVDTIKGGQRPATLSSDDVIELTRAGASQRAIDALAGRETAAAEPTPGEPAIGTTASGGSTADSAPAAEKPESTPDPGPPPLQLLVSYLPGEGGFHVTNQSQTVYTSVTLTANGEYVYQLPVPLRPFNPDSIKVGQFRSNKTGIKLDKVTGIQRLTIEAREGRWSQRY